MSPGDLLIDGYNVLHAAGLARRSYGPGEFEKCRFNLIRLISQQLSPRERRRTTIVFDAGDRTVLPSPPQMVHDVLVLFADEGGDADSTIERLIQQNSAPRRLCVVSSDHRLQRAARRRRARFEDSDAFLQRLANRSATEHRRRQQAEPATKRSGQLPPGEVEAWLRVFDDQDQIHPAAGSDGFSPDTPSPKIKVKDSSPICAADDHTVLSSVSGQQMDDVTGEVEFWESRIAELWDGDTPKHD